MEPSSSKYISMNFPNLLELSFLTVFAFPKAVIKNLVNREQNHESSLDLPSRMGFVCRILSSISECLPLMAARYCRMSLVLSVLPAPDSPLITTHWFCLNKTQQITQAFIYCIVILCSLHDVITVVSNCEHMRGQLTNLFPPIHFDCFRVVERVDDLVRVNCHQDGASVGL